MKKRVMLAILCIALVLPSAACKKEFTKMQADTYSVNMPGKPEQSYVEFPLKDLNSTLPLTTYESSIGDAEYFSVGKVDWTDALNKVKEMQGENWNQEDFYNTTSNAFFSTMVSGGQAGGAMEEIEVDGHRAFSYAITALKDPKTGESILSDNGKGSLIIIPTPDALYILTYYANLNRFDEARMNLFLESFNINK